MADLFHPVPMTQPQICGSCVTACGLCSTSSGPAGNRRAHVR
jgi:hypothetical protein